MTRFAAPGTEGAVVSFEARYDHSRHPNSLVEAQRKGTKA